MKKIIIILALCVSAGSVLSQQDAMFTHYMFNTLAVNPAYAGSRGVPTVTGLHRSQWVGFGGAPTTQTLTFHTPIFTEAVGVGFSIVNDVIGPIKQTSFYGDFSYKVNLTSKTRLSFGIKAGGNLFQGDLASVQTAQAGDQAFANIPSKFLPNVGAGLYLSNDNWYAGLSVPKLIVNELDNASGTGNNLESRHYFFIAGYVQELTESIKFKPTTFVKMTQGAPVQADLTASFIFADKLELGIAGRTNDGLGALIGFNFTPELKVGYSYDWSLGNRTGVYNSGSHEVMLRYDIIRKVDKTEIVSPRYF